MTTSLVGATSHHQCYTIILGEAGQELAAARHELSDINLSADYIEEDVAETIAAARSNSSMSSPPFTVSWLRITLVLAIIGKKSTTVPERLGTVDPRSYVDNVKNDRWPLLVGTAVHLHYMVQVKFPCCYWASRSLNGLLFRLLLYTHEAALLRRSN